jgi:hypothetical protein
MFRKGPGPKCGVAGTIAAKQATVKKVEQTPDNRVYETYRTGSDGRPNNLLAAYVGGLES